MALALFRTRNTHIPFHTCSNLRFQLLLCQRNGQLDELDFSSFYTYRDCGYGRKMVLVFRLTLQIFKGLNRRNSSFSTLLR